MESRDLMTEPLPRGSGILSGPLHLRDYWHVVLRRKGIAFFVFFLVMAAGAARTVFVKRLWEGTVQILIEKDVPSVIDFEKGARAPDSEIWDDFYQTQYKLLQSRLLAREVIKKLHILRIPEMSEIRSNDEVTAAEEAPPGTNAVMEQAIDDFLDKLKVQPVKDSELVTVSYQAPRPDLAAKIANTLSQAYIQQTLDFRYRTSAEAASWLQDEAKNQSQRVEAAERALQKFTDEQGLTNIEERRSILDQRLKDLGSALTVAKTRRLDKEAQYRQMQGASNSEELPDVMRDPVIQSLRSDLAQLEKQGSQLSAKGYLDGHPEMVRLKEQIDGIKQKIAIEASRTIRAADNDFRVAEAQEASASAALEQAKREASDLQQRSLKYDALKRDLDASKTLSQNVDVREKQTDVARDVQAQNIHIIDQAVIPQFTSRPKPIRDTALAALLGILLGVGAAFFRDYLDTTIGKPSDVRVLGLPLLGVIPETPGKGSQLLSTNGSRKEPFAEGYRVLRTAIHTPIAGQKPGEVLLLTSTLPREGKTLTAVNLALTLAAADDRVLLIDADLRRPSLSALLHSKRIPGLCEVVTGFGQFQEAVHKVPGTRLNLLPCGTAVEGNPADLLATEGMRTLLEKLRGQYSKIVIDTPPAGIVADALILAPMVDGVLVVAHSGKVGRAALLQTLERLDHAKANILGVVLNRARPEKNSYDYGPAFVPYPYYNDDAGPRFLGDGHKQGGLH
jgi:capsular exopolysaccharide synthesis family protein